MQDFECIIVDNSGRNLVRGRFDRVRIIENAGNLGFGAAINQGITNSDSEFVVTLNDDAAAEPGWLAALLHAAESEPGIGMCASQVRLSGSAGAIDSAGMLVCGDGSSKQRGHGAAPHVYSKAEPALLPSGSAALYRRAMLNEIGGFDDDFFLYCEDTDLGLRARWAGWTCIYVPGAVVQHRYSHSAGRASGLKAYYVERNRLFLLVKNYPAGMLLLAPFIALVRYAWHLLFLLQGKGAAADYRQEGSGASLAWFVIRAHAVTLLQLPSLWRKRKSIRASARIDSRQFSSLLKQFSISPKQVAAH